MVSKAYLSIKANQGQVWKWVGLEVKQKDRNILNRVQKELEFPMLWMRRNDVHSLLQSLLSRAAASAAHLVVFLSIKFESTSCHHHVKPVPQRGKKTFRLIVFNIVRKQGTKETFRKYSLSLGSNWAFTGSNKLKSPKASSENQFAVLGSSN